MRRTRGRFEQWSEPPELVVLTSVMQFQGGGASEYVATSGVLGGDEVDDLVTDLTGALRVLTGNTFENFAAVRREAVAPGRRTRIIRPHQIVVGRYRDVQRQVGVLGFGGRSVGRDGAITAAALLLDDDYDRLGPMRGQLRTHELGHALGYRHVESRLSIMNPRIGAEVTELDRRIGAVAYRASGLPHDSASSEVAAPADYLSY